MAGSRSPARPWATKIAFALIAALVGMTTCRYTLGVVVVAATKPTNPGPHSMWWFVAPFLLGGVVVALVYLALPRIFAALSGTESRQSVADTRLAPGDDGSSAAEHEEPRSAIGPMAILLIVVAISTAIPAGIVALIPASGSEDVISVAVLGAGLGLLIGIPAALVIWVARRRRSK